MDQVKPFRKNHEDQENDEDNEEIERQEDVDERSIHILDIGEGAHLKQCLKHLQKLVRSKLTALEIPVPDGRQGRSSKPRNRSGKRNAVADFKNKIPLSNSILTENLVEVRLRDGTRLQIPRFLKVCNDFIRKDLDTEGIFRVQGGVIRKAKLIEELLRPTSQLVLSENYIVSDFCCAMKRILFLLESPLIPYELHETFRGCLERKSKELCVASLLDSICLLPAANISVLSYLIQLFQEVTHHSSKNKMVSSNLATSVVESIMPTSTSSFGEGTSLVQKPSTAISASGGQNCLLHTVGQNTKHSQILEMLIEYAGSVGFITAKLHQDMIQNSLFFKEAESSDEDNSGKKRRSGSLNRFLGFWRGKSKPVSDSVNSSARTPINVLDSAHTPIIKAGSKKFGSKANQMNSATTSQTKNQILEAIRRNAMKGPGGSDTPLYRPSPEICFETSPKDSEDVQTPFGPKRKHLITTNLLRKRLKTSTPTNHSAAKESSVSAVTKVVLAVPLPSERPTPTTNKLDLLTLDGSPRKSVNVNHVKHTSTSKSPGLANSPRPRPHSFNSPRTTPTASGNNTLSRSPTRRTLRRGRPNTLRVGLARPSPTNNVVKMETSPTSTKSAVSSKLTRSVSSSGHNLKREVYMYGGIENASPRKKVILEPSGRVRNSNGRPALEIPKPSTIPEIYIHAVPELEIEPAPSSSFALKSNESIKSVATCVQTNPSLPLRMHASLSVNNCKSSSKMKSVGSNRSQSMRDPTRSYIPRLILNTNLNCNKNPPQVITHFNETPTVQEETSKRGKHLKTPDRPQKSVSTSAITPIQQQLQRRNSVQELVNLYETNAKRTNNSQLENKKPKPYSRRPATLERFTVRNDPSRLVKLQSTKPNGGDYEWVPFYNNHEKFIKQ